MAEDSKIHHLAWFIAGLGVGAVVGILYAPKSGRETREDIAAGAKQGTEFVKVKAQQAADQASVIIDKGREHVATIVDKSKEQVGQYVDRSRDVVDRGRAQWEEFVERGKNLVTDQSARVGAAVDAGREAYRSSTATTSTTSEPL
jgi:gas vesicle protein